MSARRIFIASQIFLLPLVTLLISVRFLRARPPASGNAPTTVNWLHYGNDLANTRFQNVDQVNPANVGKLKVAWVFHTKVLDEQAELETSPIAVNGTLFVTDGHDDVFALNAATEEVKWSYKPLEIPGEMPPLDQIKVCCGRNNRGVVFVPGTVPGTGKVVYNRLDDVAVALDANTGTVLWRTVLADFHAGIAMNMAPQFAKGWCCLAYRAGNTRFAVR